MFHCDHQLTGLIPFSGGAKLELKDKSCFAACGIGNPESFLSLLTTCGARLAGHRFFGDHHPFAPKDAQAIVSAARNCGAEYIVVTQKDWAKLREFPEASRFHWADLQLCFPAADARGLLQMAMERTKP